MIADGPRDFDPDIPLTEFPLRGTKLREEPELLFAKAELFRKEELLSLFSSALLQSKSELLLSSLELLPSTEGILLEDFDVDIIMELLKPPLDKLLLDDPVLDIPVSSPVLEF